MGIEDDWAAYQFDIAILQVGLEVELDAQDPKRKQRKAKGKSGLVGLGPIQKMAIPANGVW